MNTPTAEILLESYRFKAGEHVGNSDYNLMINYAKEFAKLHIQAQTEAILERLELRGEHNTIDKNIIINAYPLTNIK
jgi:hypothetical protein